MEGHGITSVGNAGGCWKSQFPSPQVQSYPTLFFFLLACLSTVASRLEKLYVPIHNVHIQ